MKIQCGCCETVRHFPPSFSIQEIEDEGTFCVWGMNEDTSPFCVCRSCLENDPKKSETKEKENKEKMVQRGVKTLIISGLFLGNPKTNRKNILSLIDSDYDKLIVNGDVIDGLFYHALDDTDKMILLRLEAEQAANNAIIIRGNDEHWINNIEKYTKLVFTDNYTLNYLGYPFHFTSTRELGQKSAIIDAVKKLAKAQLYSVVFVGNDIPCLHKIEEDGRPYVLYINTGNFLRENGICSWVELDGINNLLQLHNSKDTPLKGDYSFKEKKKESNVVVSNMVIPRINGKQEYDII